MIPVVEMKPIIAFFGLVLVVSNGEVHEKQATMSTERIPTADIALIIDQSGSIGAQNYEEEIDFAQQFISSFPISEDKTRIALIEFSLPNMTRVRLNWKAGMNEQVVQSTLEKMRHDQLGTGTDFAKAWLVALEELQTLEAGDRPEAPNVAVMVTDGYLNSKFERNPAFSAARRLRTSGTLIYAIHVKLDPGAHEAPIDDLAEMTGNRSRVFAVDDFKRLKDELLTRITQQIAEEYQDCVYEYEPTGQCFTTIERKCVQDASMTIIRQPQAPFGHPCPSSQDIPIMECPPGSCQDACERWPWGNWGDCVSENCGLNGTKTRRRDGSPLYDQLTSTCVLTESKPCSKEELMETTCPESGVADNLNVAGLAGSSSIPVWAIILIVLLCTSFMALTVAGIIIYRSPRWRMVFVPREHRKNQLPGNCNDNASTACL